MAEKYFIRLIGNELWEDTKLMSKSKADAELEKTYNRVLKERGLAKESKFFSRELNAKDGFFMITDEEFYQEARILKENTATGPDYLFEEIRRMLYDTAAAATKYQYDLTDMSVGDYCLGIEERLENLEKMLHEHTTDLLSSEQKEEVYRQQRDADLMEDARIRFCEWSGYYEGDLSAEAAAEDWFKAQYGFTIKQALNPKSKYYVLERAKDLFLNRESIETAELATWESALQDACHELSPKKK